MTEKRTILSEGDLISLWRDLKALPLPFRIAINTGKEARTSAQNRLLHKWYGEIATQKADETALDVKLDCNIAYGIPILSRDDEEWAAVFGHIFRGLDIERKRKAIRVLDVPFTRNMTVKQLTEYMDQMERDYRGQEYILTHPDDRGREDMRR